MKTITETSEKTFVELELTLLVQATDKLEQELEKVLQAARE